ncbi:uncharacterized protein JCM15063_003682 [Sporobolomyces koalae]|uniref:uncharacterized protein n=1 Tax=Sporobolomyces koalae TaxID=500713 RepID=UPI0031716298
MLSDAPHLVKMPSPPRSSPTRTSEPQLSSEAIGDHEMDEDPATSLQAEVDLREQDQDATEASSAPANPRRSALVRDSSAGTRRRGSGAAHALTAFERERLDIERRNASGPVRNERARHGGTELHIWDKVLDKNGYVGQLAFDPFEERHKPEAFESVQAS